MKMSQEVQAQYEKNRLEMNTINRQLRYYLIAHLALAAVEFFSALFAGALSTLDKSGPEKFYVAMSAGVFQILLAIATIVLGWLAAYRRRIPSLILLGLDIVGLGMILTQQNGSFHAANVLFLGLGVAMEVWGQVIFNHDDELKEFPGYPVFSVEADQRAEYEAPLHVTARKASSEMESIGESKTPQPKRDAAMEPLMVSDDVQFADLAENSRQYATETPMLAPADPTTAALEALQAGVPSQTETALPELDPSVMLSDMTPENASHTYDPDQNSLPDPDEVRKRLAAMRQQRQQGDM